MKRYLLFSFALLITAFSFAQSSKQVLWNYSVKKIADKTYEVHLSATINGDYHLYAQDAGGEGPVATAFTFSPNPLIAFNGKVKEEGKLISKYESAWKHDVKYYEKNSGLCTGNKIKSKCKNRLSWQS